MGEDAKIPAKTCSPRPWGWTGPEGGEAAVDRVFPTPVGMDRHRLLV